MLNMCGELEPQRDSGGAGLPGAAMERLSTGAPCVASATLCYLATGEAPEAAALIATEGLLFLCRARIGAPKAGGPKASAPSRHASASVSRAESMTDRTSPPGW